MTGKNTGLVGLLRKKDVNVSVLHCIIHQEVLCSKFAKMNYVVKDETRIVHLNRGGNSAQSRKKLVEFLKELSVEFHEIRWLSAGKNLAAFVTIRKEVTEFLENAGKIEYDPY
ncbi:hypothetical protein PR048_028854 [Dryococelus australis]|uniref:Uncharacterized protein n=1 Tax=Dryococelus australis TaxID=614101 RepID=A0ABQ9GBQ0_9NEOP|nr:hypothetical protein PR048_028854 [Dryococelus australis]